ncbi:MAG: MarR family transcriptional regulator [Patescibacteria group bacterium]
MERSVLPSMYDLCLMHARADRAMRVVVSEQLEPYNITMMEWLALGVVSGGPKRGLSMTRVASTLNVTLPQVTALITSLVKWKLIKQRVLDTDRRGRQVIVTLKGKRALGKIESDIAKAMREWSSDIPKEQLRDYILTVSQLAK